MRGECRDGIKRVIFLYPTRATATEGFRDYVSWAPEDDGALMHGTAEYDLQGMFSNPSEAADPRRNRDFDVDSRLFALGFWPRRIFAATVDQFFGFLQHAYGPTCLLPLLADSVVVVDEVHSFDRALFSALKQFLQAFDVPVLCMTATLPQVRRNELSADCGLTVYDEKPGELESIAAASRYYIERVSQSAVLPRIRDAIREGKRVLWVMNKVKRAQVRALSIAIDGRNANATLHAAPGVRLYCYHSRFKLADRKRQHQEVVCAFQGDGQAALAITTQVCEMSLDMDADVLVTEHAPITALIQRMGRCNRRSRPRKNAGTVVVYKPDDEKPYDAVALSGVEAFLDDLAGKGFVSQLDLERGLVEYGPEMPDIPSDCNFLTSGPYATAGEDSLRDIDEFTVPGILESDIQDVRRLYESKRPIAGFVVPVPRRFAGNRHSGLPSYLTTAPDNHYHPSVGFCDMPIHIEGGPI